MVLSSSLLDSSLSLAHQHGQHSPLEAQIRTRSHTSVAVFNSTEELLRKQSHSKPPPSFLIPFFFFGSSQKTQTKPLIEEMGALAEGHDPYSNLSLNAKPDPTHGPEEPMKVSMKKPTRGPKRVVFTPQKARELRKKLKESDSFHDFMYHSSIASRLATHDS